MKKRVPYSIAQRFRISQLDSTLKELKQVKELSRIEAEWISSRQTTHSCRSLPLLPCGTVQWLHSPKEH